MSDMPDKIGSAVRDAAEKLDEAAFRVKARRLAEAWEWIGAVVKGEADPADPPPSVLEVLEAVGDEGRDFLDQDANDE